MHTDLRSDRKELHRQMKHFLVQKEVDRDSLIRNRLIRPTDVGEDILACYVLENLHSHQYITEFVFVSAWI